MAIVIPTLNEKKNISSLLPQLKWMLPFAKIYVIDDGSTDGTAEIARKHGACVVSFKERMGLGRSYLFGIMKALSCRHEYIAILDADHPAGPLCRMLEKMNWYDVTIGEELGTRSMASKIAGAIARRLLKLNVSQPTCGYMLIKRNVIDGIDVKTIKSRWDAVHLELLFRAKIIGARIAEVPFKGISHESASFKRVMLWLLDVFSIWRHNK